MRTSTILTLAVMLSVLIAGCLGTGTVTFKKDIDEFYSTSGFMHKEMIDLTTNKDYDDNKDRIKSIDQVSVVGWFVNDEPVDNYAEIYISEDGSFTEPAEVRENATRVYKSLVIPGGDSVFVDWADALPLIENLPYLKERVLDGRFWLYGLAENSPFAVHCRLTLIVTFTVGLS
jgi:hypothetical protein